jgi:hypothetical protein
MLDAGGGIMPDGEMDGRTGKLILLASILLLVFIIIGGGIFWWYAQQRRNGQPPVSQPPVSQPPAGQPPTGQPPAGQPPAPPVIRQRTVGQQQRVERFIDDGRDFRLGNTREEIIANLGEPRSETVARIPNRHDPQQTDRYYTIEYDGLTVEIYHVTAGDRQLLDSVIITDARHPVKYDLGIGTAISHVTEVLGQPNERRDNTLIYEDAEGLDRVIFTPRNNRVSRIEWDYYVD